MLVDVSHSRRHQETSDRVELETPIFPFPRTVVADNGYLVPVESFVRSDVDIPLRLE